MRFPLLKSVRWFCCLVALLGPISALAEERVFPLTGASLTLTNVSAEVDVYFRSMRLNRALSQWNVEMTVSNKGQRTISGPLVVVAESVSGSPGVLLTDGTDGSGKKFYDITGQAGDGALSSGEESAPRTIALALGAGSPVVSSRVFAPPLTKIVAALTRSLNEAGQPLPSVEMQIVGPSGADTHQTDKDSGVASFGQGAGTHNIKFSREGYLPIWREKSLALQGVTVVPNPRLTKRSASPFNVTPLSEIVVSNATGSIQINVAAGAVSQNATITLTPLTAQNLPAFLPMGWSPLRAFWLESSSQLQSPPNATVLPTGAISGSETAALVRWNESGLHWVVVQTLGGSGTNAVHLVLPGEGAYVLVVGDTGELAPPPPQINQVLSGISVGAIEINGFTATGSVTPTASPASTVPELVTGTANVVLKHASRKLPSGYLLRGEVTETYLLSDGSLRLTPQYEQFITGYQRPGDQDLFTLHASFPMRPLLLFGPDQLDSATVRVDVLTETPFDGQVLDENGGQIASEGVRLLAGSGRLTGPSALRLRRLDATVFTNLVGQGHTVIAAFDLTVDGSTIGDTLAPQLTGAPANGRFVLARLLSDTGFYGLQPTERLQSDLQGNLQSLEPAAGDRLPGLRGSGQFVLIQVQQPQGLVIGVARNGQGALQAGMPVRLTGLPWLTLTDDQGRFQLVSPVGERDLNVTNPLTGDTGFVAVNITDPATVLVQNLAAAPSGPRVAKITPAHNAQRIPRVGSVVIEFNEAINPASVIGSAIQILRTNDSVVPAALTLNLRNTIATLSPATELDADTIYRVRLAATIADPGGLPIEGQTEFSFKTVPLSTRDPAAQLIIYEPGATNVPAAVLALIPAYEPGSDPLAIVVRGTPGTADPEVPVILVNESSGETATVLSKPDGSFANVISGTEEDFVSATFVNLNGTRVYVPVSRQEFDNGFVGLYPQGGILEAQSDGGPVRVLIEPLAITTKAKVRIKIPTAAELAQLLGDTKPEVAAPLAKPIIFEGEAQPMQGPIKVSFTVDLAAAGYPTNADPVQSAIALVQVTDTDGIKAFEVLDQLQFTPNSARTPARVSRLRGFGPPRKTDAEQTYFGVVNSVIGLIPQAGIANNVFRYVLMPILVGGKPIVVKGRVFQSLDIPQLNNPLKVNDPLLQGFKFEQLGSTFKLLDLAGQAIDSVNNVNNLLTDLLEGRPLGGAFVTLQNVYTPDIPGHVRPGMVYCTSDREGAYLMVAPTTPWLEIQPGDFYLVMATHPRFREKLSEKLFALQDLSIAGVAFKNFTFRDPLPLQVPPTVNVAHAPPYPAAGEMVELQVNAAQGFQGNPQVNAFVDQVFPAGQQLTGVNFSNVQITTNGNHTRWSGEIQATNTIRRVMLRVSVIASGGEVKVVRYPISFTGAPAPSNDGVIPPSDPNEEKGPSVTASFPVEGGLVNDTGEITLIFNEPIDRRVESDISGLTLSPSPTGVSPAVRLSADQTTLTLQYAGLSPDTDYTLTVAGASVMDLSGNPLDQRPSTLEPDSFSLVFRTPPIARFNLPGMVNGVGSVIHGARLYALDSAAPPRLRTYDISNPARPVLLSSMPLVGTPRDLVVIPQYAYKLNIHLPTHTNDLVAVVGGDLDAIVDALDSVIVKGQYLRVFEMADPRNPVEIASPIVSYRVSAAAAKVRWQAPHLIYQEYGQDLQQIVFVNLQELLIGWHATPTQRDAFPDAGKDGVDADGNGDFAGPGDLFPVPQRRPAEFYGKKQSYIITGSTQKILDFSVSGGTLGVTLTGGYGLKQGGGVDTGNPVFPQYRTMAFNGVDIAAGSVDFASGDYPGRVTIIDGLPVEHGGQLYTPIVALVSLSPDRLGRHRLVTLDISLPESPTLIADVIFPPEVVGGGLRSIKLGEDGLLELTTVSSVFYLNSRLLSRPNPPAGQLHPAIVGFLPDGGGRMRSVGSSPAGLHSAAEGGRNEIVQTAPRLAFVTFPLQSEIVDPRYISRDEGAMNTLLSRAQRAEHLVPARVRADHLGHTSDLFPANPEVHYHVLVEAPGGAGEKIQLGMESLSPAGWPLPNKGVGFPPVRAVAARTLEALGIKPRADCDASVRPLAAYRLSDDPRSPNFNRYLSRPFVVIYESVSQSDLALQQLTADRELMWSGARMRAFIEPTEQNNEPLGPFAARVDMPRGVIFPVGSVVADTLDVSYIMGPNPPPPGGDVRAPGTFGSVSSHSGEIRTEAADFALPSPRMPISIQRTIGGQDNYDGPFGLGWDFNYNQRVTELRPELFPQGFKMPLIARGTPEDSVVGSSKDLLFHTGAGRMVLFQWVGEEMPPEYATDPLFDELGYKDRVADYFLPEPGVFDLLVKFTDGKYERITPDGMRYQYAANGRLETVYDRFPANRHELDYDRQGALRRIDDRSVTVERFLEFGHYKRSTDFEFVSDLDEVTDNTYLLGKICRLRDYTGRDVRFFYSDEGLLVRREGVKVAGENGGFSGRHQTHYLYEQCRFLGVAVGPDHTLLMVTATQPGAGGVPVAMEVNGIGGNTGAAVPPDNVARTLEGLSTSFTQPDGRVTEFTFNKFGQPSSTKISGPGVSPALLKQEFNKQGQVTVVQYPEGRVERMAYDSNNPIFRSRGNLLSMTVETGPRGGDGYTETHEYEPHFNLQSGGQKNANGFTTTYTLSADKRFVESIQHDVAGSEVMGYNEHGQMTSRTDYDGLSTTLDFNSSNGFLDSSRRGTFTTQYSYSGVPGLLGQATQAQPPRGAAIQTSYNANLQPVQMTRGESIRRMAYDGQGRSTFQEAIVGDGKRRETRLTIDELGFVYKRTVNGVEVNGAETSLEYTYKPDKLLRVEEVHHPGGSLQKFSYNALGYTTTMELESYKEEYATDLHGNVLSVKKGGDVVATTEYDGLDRPKSGSVLTGTQTYLTERSYFPGGQLKTQKVTDPVFGVVHDQVVNQIDALGRILSSTVNGDTVTRNDSVVHGVLQRTSTRPSQTTTERWNSAGYPTAYADSIVNATIVPDGNGNTETATRAEDGATYISTFTYDDLDHRKTVADSFGPIAEFTPRADGKNTKVKNARNNVTTLEHSALGEVLRRHRADGMEFRFGHDEQRQMAYSGDPAKGFEFDYDNLFRLTRRTQRDGAEIKNDSFDPRNQPTSVTIPGGTMSMTYDLQTRVKTSTVGFGNTTYQTSSDYDALNRVRVVNYSQSGGLPGRASYSYDKAGPLLNVRFEEAGADLSVAYNYRNDLSRTRITYPSGYIVNQERDNAGRLVRTYGTIEDIVTVTEWAGNQQPKTVNFGGVLRARSLYDSRGRLTASRYQRINGPVQAEMRYQYDAANNVEMRQFLHRAGKTDNFSYDNGERLVRGQMGGLPLQGDTGISRITYQRNYNYEATGLDHLLTAPLTGVVGAAPPFSENWTGHDAFLLPGSVGGVSRGNPDALGRVAQAQLWTRPAIGSAPVPVVANLTHNGMGQLVKVERADGVVIENFFQPGGLRYARKTTQAGSVVDYRHFVYDDSGRLLEEFDRTGASPVLLARYFYMDSDAPCAVDLPEGNGTFRRHYYVRDDQKSVVAVADRFGILEERIWYDPFGQPVIEPRDDTAPVVKRVIAGENGKLLIELSEPVGPIVFDLGLQPGIRRFNSILTDLVSEPAGLTDLPAQVPGYAPSTVIVFTPQQPLTGPVNVRIRPGNLTDDWDNHLLEETLSLNVTGTVGTVYYAAAPVPNTDVSATTRSPVGSPFLWHGQYFDYDTGLVYLRARFYDPFGGMFLEPDPMGYEDSVNLYAGMGNNPTTLRDPSGLYPYYSEDNFKNMSEEQRTAFVKNCVQQSEDIRSEGERWIFSTKNNTAAAGYAVWHSPGALWSLFNDNPVVNSTAWSFAKTVTTEVFANDKVAKSTGDFVKSVGLSAGKFGSAFGVLGNNLGKFAIGASFYFAGKGVMEGLYEMSQGQYGKGANDTVANGTAFTLGGVNLAAGLGWFGEAVVAAPTSVALAAGVSLTLANDSINKALDGQDTMIDYSWKLATGQLNTPGDEYRPLLGYSEQDRVAAQENWMSQVKAGTYTTPEYEEEKRQLRRAQGGWRDTPAYSNDGF